MGASACAAAAGAAPSTPFKPAPRYWQGNMCGTRVPDLPAVPGGAADPSLVLSWFIDRYSAADRLKIYAAWKAKHLTHVLVSWPDAQQFGHTPQQFRDTCVELVKQGFYPCAFLSAKPIASNDIRSVEGTIANILLVLPLLVGIVPDFCIGWELSLWLSPTDVQTITDAIAPVCLKQVGTRVYVHFQERYMSFPQPDCDNASYWQANVGKLTGVVLQRKLGSSDADFLDWLNDCLERAAGNDGMPAEIIDGHGVDLVALELNAQDQFNGTADEAEGTRLGKLAINAPARNGPAGVTAVMGFGNG